MQQKKLLRKKVSIAGLLDRLVSVRNEVNKALPELSEVEKAALDQEIAIRQLYYSSSLEGSHLTEHSIEKAIYGKAS